MEELGDGRSTMVVLLDRGPRGKGMCTNPPDTTDFCHVEARFCLFWSDFVVGYHIYKQFHRLISSDLLGSPRGGRIWLCTTMSMVDPLQGLPADVHASPHTCPNKGTASAAGKPLVYSCRSDMWFFAAAGNQQRRPALEQEWRRRGLLRRWFRNTAGR